MDIKKLFFVSSALFGLWMSIAQAAITFSVDEFTTDSLGITFTTNETLDGPAPSGELGGLLFFGGKEGTLVSDWINASDFSVSGSSGTFTIGVRSSVVLFNYSFSGFDALYLSFSGNLTAGSLLTGADPSISISDTSLFNTAAIDTLYLTWGTVSNPADPRGTFQSSVVVPEAEHAALGLAALAAGIVLMRKRLAKKSL